MTKLVNHVEQSLEDAEISNSNIDSNILNIDGLIGDLSRHFINNVCTLKNCRYLEVGSWKGSSLCSALSNNKIKCLSIDNWKESDKLKGEFFENFNKYKGSSNATFLERDCWNLDESSIGSYNVYLYDGEVSEKCNFDGLNKFLGSLDKEFVYLVNNIDSDEVLSGTNNAITKNGLEILFNKVIDSNRLGIYVLKKSPLVDENEVNFDDFTYE